MWKRMRKKRRRMKRRRSKPDRKRNEGSDIDKIKLSVDNGGLGKNGGNKRKREKN